MLKINPSFTGKMPVRSFERIGKYKNPELGTFLLNIQSSAPRTYDMLIKNYDSNGKMSTAFREHSPIAEHFKVWSENAINKVRNACEDSQIIDDMTAFFAEISK